MYSLSIDYFEVVVVGALTYARARFLICRLVHSLSAIKWNYNKTIFWTNFSSLKAQILFRTYLLLGKDRKLLMSIKADVKGDTVGQSVTLCKRVFQNHHEK